MNKVEKIQVKAYALLRLYSKHISCNQLFVIYSFFTSNLGCKMKQKKKIMGNNFIQIVTKLSTLLLPQFKNFRAKK